MNEWMNDSLLIHWLIIQKKVELLLGSLWVSFFQTQQNNSRIDKLIENKVEWVSSLLVNNEWIQIDWSIKADVDHRIAVFRVEWISLMGGEGNRNGNRNSSTRYYIFVAGTSSDSQ